MKMRTEKATVRKSHKYASKISCGDAPSYEINTATIVLQEKEAIERRESTVLLNPSSTTRKHAILQAPCLADGNGDPTESEEAPWIELEDGAQARTDLSVTTAAIEMKERARQHSALLRRMGELERPQPVAARR